MRPRRGDLSAGPHNFPKKPQRGLAAIEILLNAFRRRPRDAAAASARVFDTVPPSTTSMSLDELRVRFPKRDVRRPHVRS